MSSRIVEVSRQSWLSRLQGAIGGVVLGVALVAGATLVLFWNEGRAVRTARALREGAGAVVSVDARAVETGHDGKLVHVAGRATTTETLSDADLGVSVQALALRREVEMYQWVERTRSTSEKKLGGAVETTTTYDYEKAWSKAPIPSSGFRSPAGHENPEAMRYEPSEWRAASVTVGAFELSASLCARVDGWQPVAATVAPDIAGLKLESGGYYIGADPAAPQVGDVRIRFASVPPMDVSIVARQRGRTFEPWTSAGGTAVELLVAGIQSSETMFASAKTSSAAMAWFLRLAGFLIVALGINAVFRPMAVMADVIPLIGTMMGAGLGMVSLVLAFCLSSATVAFAWLFFRPFLAISLLLLGVASVGAVAAVGWRRAGQAA